MFSWWACKLQCCLTVSVPNFRRHLSSAFFFFFFVFNFVKLSPGKTFICKVERLNVKQRRSRWDGSMSRLIWIYAVCKSLLWSPVAVKELMKYLNETVTPMFVPICFLCFQGQTLQIWFNRHTAGILFGPVLGRRDPQRFSVIFWHWIRWIASLHRRSVCLMFYK